MIAVPMYPLRFEPIYQYRVWGGRQLTEYLAAPLPAGPVGEAWILSDRADHASTVAAGPLKGFTIQQLIEHSPEPILGRWAGRFKRFPVLLKFLDAHEKLSVQVHPPDGEKAYIPSGESGKTEAWVVLAVAPEGRIYAGLKAGATRESLERAITARSLADLLPNFAPVIGDAVLIKAGTVHSLSGLMVFEVQENSDVTFRLYDWDRTDPKTGHKRPLQVESALDCINYTQGSIGPLAPVLEAMVPVCRERLLDCTHFRVWRHSGNVPFPVGAAGEPRVLIAIAGTGEIEHRGTRYAIGNSGAILLPAAVGACICRPGESMTVLEIAIPEVS
jgi:mannose-6-phosphate isomerase